MVFALNVLMQWFVFIKNRMADPADPFPFVLHIDLSSSIFIRFRMAVRVRSP